LNLILEQLKGVADYTGSSILTLDGGELEILAASGVNIDAEDKIRGLRLVVDRAPMLWGILSRREPVIIDDIRGDTALARDYRSVIGEYLEWPGFRYIRSWLGVPLALKDRVIGMISLSRDEPGFYTEYHATLAVAIANHAAVAIENARLFEQVQGKAALEERQRLARELHDSVSQALFSIALGARTARTLLDRDPAQVAQPLDYVLNLAEAGLAEMRALIFELRPESLATEGLVAALEKQAAALKARHAIETELALGDEPDIPLAAKEALYRIGQEALHNVVKHARASKVSIGLTMNEGVLSLALRDDGVGFDPSGTFPGHLGLRSMRERVAALGGTLDVESAPGQGTQTRATIPVT
jgi:signal transduction histidine kinase